MFLDREGSTPQLELRGQIEGLFTNARFSARDAGGARRAEEDCGSAVESGHEGAAHFLLNWLERRLGGQRLVAAGHRVVHGGRGFSAPVRVNPAVLTALERLVPLAPLHQPHDLAAIRAVVARACRAVAWLGIELDDCANSAGGPRISRSGNPASAWVLPTNEELMIALQTRAVLGAGR